MPLPDPHAEEMSVQVDVATAIKWRTVEDEIARLRKVADALKKQLIDQIGDAYAGMIGDDKVITYRPTDRYAVKRMEDENRSLAQHFHREVTEVQFDDSAFIRAYPEIAEKYRVRSFRATTEAG